MTCRRHRWSKRSAILGWVAGHMLGVSARQIRLSRSFHRALGRARFHLDKRLLPLFHALRVARKVICSMPDKPTPPRVCLHSYVILLALKSSRLTFFVRFLRSLFSSGNKLQPVEHANTLDWHHFGTEMSRAAFSIISSRFPSSRRSDHLYPACFISHHSL